MEGDDDDGELGHPMAVQSWSSHRQQPLEEEEAGEKKLKLCTNGCEVSKSIHDFLRYAVTTSPLPKWKGCRLLDELPRAGFGVE